MREINKTIYDILKIVDPNEDISVTQLITDEVVKKSTSGEIKAGDRQEATGVLDLKAMQLEKKEGESTSTNIKRQVKASGKTARVATAGTTSKTVNVKAAGKAAPKKPSASHKSSGTTTRRVVKVASKPKKNENNLLMKILLTVVLFALAAYLYLQLN